MGNLIKYILLFFFYSGAGWCLESLYCSIGEKRFINRGFLTGPMCPIYGTAATVLTVLIYNPFKDKPLLVFLFGMVLCDIVEYLTSFIMEKLFNARWWDYTYEFLNINGRICLKHTLYWGIISVIFVKVIHPAVEARYEKINSDCLFYILAFILAVFALDLLNAIRKAADIRKLQMKLKSLQSIISEAYVSVKSSVSERERFRELINKGTDKAVEIKYSVDDLLWELEQKLSKVKPRLSENEKKDKKNILPERLFYSNPGLERYTRKQMEKLRELIDDIKANLFDGEDMM